MKDCIPRELFHQSQQIPCHSKANAAYHTPGTLYLVHKQLITMKLLSTSMTLIADTFIPTLMRPNYHDVRSNTTLLGMVLAKQFDAQTMQVGVLAACASATVTGGNGGATITTGAGWCY